jgi:hypothetical protein
MSATAKQARSRAPVFRRSQWSRIRRRNSSLQAPTVIGLPPIEPFCQQRSCA